MATVTYTCVEGDRWDLIAYKAYGDASRYNEIIQANPVIISGTLPAGLVINIPILEGPTANIPSDLLPPWKRP